MADKSLYDMTQDEALEYLRGLEGIQNIGTIQQTGGTNEYDPIFYTDAAGKEIRGGDGEYYRNVTPMFDPNYGGGVYGYYEGIYDKDGNLKDVQFRKGERHEGFLSKNLETIGPLAVLGAMGLGSGFFGLGGTEAATGAGATGMDFGAAVEAGTAGGAGATESGLGALFEGGVNTEALLGGTAADTLATGAGAGTSTGAGLSAFDAAAAYDAALTGAGSSGAASQAYTAAINAGMTQAQATMAAQTAAALEGSGMSMSSMVASGLETASAAGATGAVGAGGSIVGGGGAITPGLTGAAAGAGGLNLLANAKEFLKTLGIKDLKTALQAGLLGAGVVDYLTKRNTVDSGAGAKGTNLITPYTYTRTPRTQATAPTSADAYAYLKGQPSATTSKQQRWFDTKFTESPTYNPNTGESFVRDPNTGRLVSQAALDAAQKEAGLASGGIAALAGGGGVDGHLGGYSDGGRLLRGPGDGVSDSIPATIAGKQPARLADGEFVVPARIVSELGNGSTDAGARKLYKMMDRIQRGRRKTVGKNAVAKDSKAEKYLPA